jgi:hypothetical protein
VEQKLSKDHNKDNKLLTENEEEENFEQKILGYAWNIFELYLTPEEKDKIRKASN